MFDVHMHFFPRDLPAPSDAAVEQGWPVVADKGQHIEVFQRGKLIRVLESTAWDPVARIRAMDRLGVETQLVMPTPFTFLYDADPEIAIAFAHAQNDLLAELVAAGDGRLYGLGALPLQNPAAAIAEATRLRVALGLSGVEIGTHAGNLLLHDPDLDPLFARLVELDASVFVHPWKPLEPCRTAHSGLGFGLGRPVETELAVGSLVFGGVLDRHPNLRVCLAHGGGGVPALRGRLHNGWSRQDEASRYPGGDPRQALHRLWADGLTYDPLVLALAEDTFGPEHMVVGSDFPFAAQEQSTGASYADAVERGLLRMGSAWIDRTTQNAYSFLGSPGPRTPTSRPRSDESNPIGATT